MNITTIYNLYKLIKWGSYLQKIIKSSRLHYSRRFGEEKESLIGVYAMAKIALS
jgi:hypothetical protein